MRFEYKTITLKQKGLGLLASRSIPELDRELNAQGRDGWRFKEHILPSAAFGESDQIILVFERKID